MSAAARSGRKRPIGFFAWLMGMRRAVPGFMVPILLFSIIANLLLLVSPFYMIQVYDRILTSGSIDTLIWLTVISVFLLIIYGAAEAGRRRLCALAAVQLDELVGSLMFERFFLDPAEAESVPARLRQAAKVRGFLANQGVLPFFDLPFAPFFLGILFLIHPIVGIIGLLGSLLMIGIALWAEFATSPMHAQANARDAQGFNLALGLSRQRSAIVSMGLADGALARWIGIRNQAHTESLYAGGREVSFASSAKSIRQTLQVLVLGAGGALAVKQQVSPGAIVAGSIILGRALSPIDQIVGGWRNTASVREAFSDLQDMLRMRDNDAAQAMSLPQPDARLDLDRLAISVPTLETVLVRPFAMTLKGGEFAVLMGGIGTGKTSLLQTVVGAWPAHSGMVSLGGRDLHAWSASDRGQYVGYVPQGVELLPGTVAANISRMATEPDPDAVIAAAREAGAHEMILSLSDGYDTLIQPNASHGLSSGQTQLIGLARALYGHPVLLVLDEPTAHLDRESANHLGEVLRARSRVGAIVIASTHDPHFVKASTRVLMIRDGGLVTADTELYLKNQAQQKRPSVASTKPLS